MAASSSRRTEPLADFGLSASLQLLEDLSSLRRDTMAIVPGLHALIAEAHSARNHHAVEAVTAWLARIEKNGDGTAHTPDGSVAGWLRKVSGANLTTHRRWVVVDSQHHALTYYNDRSETDLKGILQLRGARVRPLRRTSVLAPGAAFDSAAGRGVFPFEITSGLGSGDAHAHAVAATKAGGGPLLDARASFDSADGQHTGILDPLATPSIDGPTAIIPPSSVATETSSVTATKRRSLFLAGGVVAVPANNAMITPPGIRRTSLPGSGGATGGEGAPDATAIAAAAAAATAVSARAPSETAPNRTGPARRGHRVSQSLSGVPGELEAVMGIKDHSHLEHSAPPLPHAIREALPLAAPAGSRMSISRLFGIRRARPSAPGPVAAAAATAASASSGSGLDDIGRSDHGNVAALVTPARGGRGLERPAAGAGAAPLNPLHHGKQAYVWIAETEEERTRWIEALERAIAAADADDSGTFVSMGRQFASASSLSHYRMLLDSLASMSKPLCVHADWIRIHMAASSRRTGQSHTNGSGNADTATQGLLARLISRAQAPGNAPTGASASTPGGPVEDTSLVQAGVHVTGEGAMGMMSPANKKLARVLARREAKARGKVAAAKRELELERGRSGPAPGSGGSGGSGAAAPYGAGGEEGISRAQALAAAAEEAEALHESAKTAVAVAAVASQRRRVGYTPGDRVTLRQLKKDVSRDTIEIDGVPYACADAVMLMAAIAERIAVVVRSAANAVDGFTTMGGTRGRGTSLDGALGNTNGSAQAVPNERALRALRGYEGSVAHFARDVLMCTSRTVAGGDTFDAVEMLLRNSNCALVMPDTSSPTEPVRVSIYCRKPEDEEAKRTAIDREDSGVLSLPPVLRHAPAPLTAVVPAAAAAALAKLPSGSPTSGDVEEERTAWKPIFTGHDHESSDSDADTSVMGSTAGAAAAAEASPAAPTPAADEVGAALSRLVVDVSVRMRYRVAGLDTDDAPEPTGKALHRPSKDTFSDASTDDGSGSGESDDFDTATGMPTLAIVVAQFARRFVWNASPGQAEISLQVIVPRRNHGRKG